MCKAEVFERIDEISQSCIHIQDKSEQIEDIKSESQQNLADIINKMKNQTEQKIALYKEEFTKRFQNIEESKQVVYQKVKEAQHDRDKYVEKLEQYSPIKLIKDKNRILTELVKINQRVLSIDELRPINFERLTFDEEHLKFQSFKFTIPRNQSKSEEHVMFDTKFSVRINDDLIGLFKSFDILMEPNKYGSMIFEYEIYLIKDSENERDRAKEHEDRGIIKREVDGRAMVKSAFHVEESLIRNINPIQVQLRVRPKSYSELCDYQQHKITCLEGEVNDAKAKINQLKRIPNEELKEYDNAQIFNRGSPISMRRDIRAIESSPLMLNSLQRNGAMQLSNDLWRYREEVIYEINFAIDIELEDNFIMNDCAFRFLIIYGDWSINKIGSQTRGYAELEDVSTNLQNQSQTNFKIFSKIDDETSPDLIIKVFETQDDSLIGCVAFSPETVKEIIEEEPEIMWVSLFSRRSLEITYIGCIHEEQLELPRIKLTFEGIHSHPIEQ